MDYFHRFKFSEDRTLLLPDIEDKLDGFLDVLQGLPLGLALAYGGRKFDALDNVSPFRGRFEYHSELDGNHLIAFGYILTAD
jgi:hypothetical protein